MRHFEVERREWHDGGGGDERIAPRWWTAYTLYSGGNFPH
jgi:hypothetical protein